MIEAYVAYNPDILIEWYANKSVQIILNHKKRTFDFYYVEAKWFQLDPERRSHLWGRLLDITDYWASRGYAVADGLRDCVAKSNTSNVSQLD